MPWPKPERDRQNWLFDGVPIAERNYKALKLER